MATRCRGIRCAIGSLVIAALVVTACAEEPVPPDRTPADPPAVACGSVVAWSDAHRFGWSSVSPLVRGTGVVTTIKAVVDDATGDVLVRIETSDGRIPLLFLDIDGHRLSGSWTYQTPVSAAAWNLHIDADGQIWQHDGLVDQWHWAAVSAPAEFAWAVHDGGVELCLPAAMLNQHGGSAQSLRVAAEIDDQWLPATFLDGAAVVARDSPIPPVPVRPPGRLAFAYQWAPWSIDGCADSADPIECATQRYAAFDHVVVAAGLEDADHPSHAMTVAMISKLRAAHPAIEIWGYMSLLRHQGVWHDEREIARRARAWSDIGATGVFLDEYDLCESGWRTCRRDDRGREVVVSRDRQVAAVRAIHTEGLAVFANAHSIHGALGEVRGIPAPLGDGDGVRRADMYLLENPTVWDSRWWTGLDRLAAIARFHDAPHYTAATGVRLAVVDTSRGPATAASADLVAASWWRALLAGADAHGFSNAVYSASDDLAHDVAAVAWPDDVDERLFDGAQFATPVKLADSGDVAYRIVTDCLGQPIGRVEVTVGPHGEVRGGFIATTDGLDCPAS